MKVIDVEQTSEATELYVETVQSLAQRIMSKDIG